MQQSKNYLVIGGGIMGSQIASDLLPHGNVFVTDIKDQNTLAFLPNEVHFVNYQSSPNFIKELTKFLGISFNSIIHTYIANIETAKVFEAQLYPSVTDQAVILGTLMTYNQQTWKKINPKNDFFWNSYHYQKRLVEESLEKICQQRNIGFFVPETFHILGAGYGLGLVGPHFRMNQVALRYYQSLSHIILPNNDPKPIIDARDFSRYIVQGVLELWHGYRPIFNRCRISPLDYYKAIEKKLGLNRNISILDKDEIQPQCLNQDWFPTFDVPLEFCFYSLEESIGDALNYLLTVDKPLTRDIFSIMADTKGHINVAELENTQYVPIKFYTHVSQSALTIYESYQVEIDDQFKRFFGHTDPQKLDGLQNQVTQRRLSSTDCIKELSPDLLIDLGGGFGILSHDYLEYNSFAHSIVIDHKIMCKKAQEISIELFAQHTTRLQFVACDVSNSAVIWNFLKTYLDKNNNIKSVCFNNQGLFRYIAKHMQGKFFAEISTLAKKLTELGIQVHWVFVDTELAPMRDKTMAEVSGISNVSKLTNIDTMGNLPSNFNELQSYFIENLWTITKLEGAGIVAEYQV
jgi:hypothetical protein